MNEVEAKIEQPQPTKHEDEICHIGLIHPTLISVYPGSGETVLAGYKSAYLGKRLSAKDGRTWVVVQIFISEVHTDRVMARLRRVDGK